MTGAAIYLPGNHFSLFCCCLARHQNNFLMVFSTAHSLCGQIELTAPAFIRYQYCHFEFIRFEPMIRFNRLFGLLLNAFLMRGRLVGGINH
ncbi:leu operon leader peptide [Erwinia amylovora]|uniref:leu operon leader peptide n=1 Tax=Erwinia amylovora TaxID=552 RepID=UPI0012BB7F31